MASGSQDKNLVPGQDNGLIRRWESGEESEEEQDGKAERQKKTQNEEKVTKGIATWELVKFDTKTKTRFLAKLKEIEQFWGQMVIILASLNLSWTGEL